MRGLGQKNEKNHAEENTTAIMRKKLKNKMSHKETFNAGVGWDSASPPPPPPSVSTINELINSIFKKILFQRYRHTGVKRAEAAIGALMDRDISFTSDIWTCSYKNNTFTSLTGH